MRSVHDALLNRVYDVPTRIISPSEQQERDAIAAIYLAGTRRKRLRFEHNLSDSAKQKRQNRGFYMFMTKDNKTKVAV
jgi:hypothetical protein